MADQQDGRDELGLAIVQFEDKKVRRHWNEEQEKWYFSVIDVVGALTGASIPRRYWVDLKKKLNTEGFEMYDKIVRLKLLSPDGKKRVTDCTDVETLFRLVQSIPSKKVEPIKQWLARVGYERIEETKDPEKAFDRAMTTYLRQGRTPEWVNQRLRTIEVRKELTQELSNRGIKEGREFAEITDIMTFGWAGLRTKDYKKLKGLKGQSLRDHMTTLELVLNMLAEASTTAIARAEDTQGITENRMAAHKGGTIAGNARKQLEQQTGKPVVSQENSLPKPKKKKEIE